MATDLAVNGLSTPPAQPDGATSPAATKRKRSDSNTNGVSTEHATNGVEDASAKLQQSLENLFEYLQTLVYHAPLASAPLPGFICLSLAAFGLLNLADMYR